LTVASRVPFVTVGLRLTKRSYNCAVRHTVH